MFYKIFGQNLIRLAFALKDSYKINICLNNNNKLFPSVNKYLQNYLYKYNHIFDCERALLGRWPVFKYLIQFIRMKVIQNEIKRGSTVCQGTIKPSSKNIILVLERL